MLFLKIFFSLAVPFAKEAENKAMRSVTRMQAFRAPRVKLRCQSLQVDYQAAVRVMLARHCSGHGHSMASFLWVHMQLSGAKLDFCRRSDAGHLDRVPAPTTDIQHLYCIMFCRTVGFSS